MGADIKEHFAQKNSDVQTYREFARRYNCTEGALRSYTRNHFGKSCVLTDRIPDHILEALKSKYQTTGVQSPTVTPVPLLASASLKAPKKEEYSQLQAQSTGNSIFDRLAKVLSGVGVADVIIGITSMVTMYGLASLFAEMGLVLGCLYTLVMVLVLRMCKNKHNRRTAGTGIVFVWVMEVAAVFVHTSMFNLRIWENAEQMVFKPEPDSSIPFYCAAAMGLFISAFSVFVLHVQKNRVAETVEAQQFEKDHQRAY